LCLHLVLTSRGAKYQSSLKLNGPSQSHLELLARFHRTFHARACSPLLLWLTVLGPHKQLEAGGTAGTTSILPAHLAIAVTDIADKQTPIPSMLLSLVTSVRGDWWRRRRRTLAPLMRLHTAIPLGSSNRLVTINARATWRAPSSHRGLLCPMERHSSSEGAYINIIHVATSTARRALPPFHHTSPPRTSPYTRTTWRKSRCLATSAHRLLPPPATDTMGGEEEGRGGILCAGPLLPPPGPPPPSHLACLPRLPPPVS